MCEYSPTLENEQKSDKLKQKVEISTYQFKLLDWIDSQCLIKNQSLVYYFFINKTQEEDSAILLQINRNEIHTQNRMSKAREVFFCDSYINFIHQPLPAQKTSSTKCFTQILAELKVLAPPQTLTLISPSTPLSSPSPLFFLLLLVRHGYQHTEN